MLDGHFVNDQDAPWVDGWARSGMLDWAVSEENLHAKLLWVRTWLAFDIRLCDPPRRSDWLSCSDLAIERRSSRDHYGRRFRAYSF